MYGVRTYALREYMPLLSYGIGVPVVECALSRTLNKTGPFHWLAGGLHSFLPAAVPVDAVISGLAHALGAAMDSAPQLSSVPARLLAYPMETAKAVAIGTGARIAADAVSRRVKM